MNGSILLKIAVIERRQSLNQLETDLSEFRRVCGQSLRTLVIYVLLFLSFVTQEQFAKKYSSLIYDHDVNGEKC